MGIYRNYFDKCNTIIKGSEANTANNPVTELAYGKRLTRFLFYVDITDLKNRIARKEIVIDSNTKHYLKLKSTVDFSVKPKLNLSNFIDVDDTSRPVSFDLELRTIDESWDAGDGYDFSLNSNRRSEDLDYVLSPSNWIKSTTLTDWSVPGAVATGSTLIATQHFDKGNEDIQMDITEYINEQLISTGSTYNGFCLKYSDEIEELAVNKEYVTGFFTKHTQTFFEPFIETVYDDVIRDDRNKCFLNKTNRLYLYSNIGGSLVNLDELPICTIDNVTGTTVNQQSKGIYYVEFTPTQDDFTSYKKYNDVWSNLKMNGKILENVKMNFIPKDESEYYQLKDEMILPQHYGLSLSGIHQEEKLTSGEQRRINVLARKPYTVNDNDIIDTIEYRLYVIVGTAQETIIDWSPVSRSNLHNYFTLDTSWMIPNKYHIDIKIKQNGEVLLYNNQLVFNVVNRRKL